MLGSQLLLAQVLLLLLLHCLLCVQVHQCHAL
jgi:hypothetical protein